jgi:hypothetical protein
MRRVLSILLALAFGLGPVVFAMGYDEDASLPSCCRRHGTHHCGMDDVATAYMTQVQAQTPSFTAPSRCPFYPHTFGILSPVHALPVPGASLPAEALASYRAGAHTFNERKSELALQPSRGPPLFRSTGTC